MWHDSLWCTCSDLDSSTDLVLVLKYPVKVLRQFRKGDVVVMRWVHSASKD